jgi:DNA mismatch repair protein MutS2
MKSAYEALEFGEIEKELFPCFRFEENIIDFQKSDMIQDPAVLDNEHSLLSEAVYLSQQGLRLSLLHVYPLSDSLKILFKGGVLSIKTLADYIPFFDDCEVFSQQIAGRKDLKRLNQYALEISDFSYLKERLSQAILPDLTIADDASSELFVIRTKIRKAQSSIGEALRQASQKYSQYLADTPETVKNGLPSLAVRSDLKGRVPGMAVEMSHTGQTTYIVPLEVLDIQNQIFELKGEEEQEIERIIEDLSALLKQNYDALLKAYQNCLLLDSVFGRVSYGLSYEGSVAWNSDSIKLQDLAHPLLRAEKVVRNNISLGGEKPKILVISGPNAGGKTVLIKAVALAVYMNQRGLLVCARGDASLPLVDKIFFLTGDSQSIMDSLSTFSGHIAALKEGLDEIDRDSLFVVDEIGQGTSPSDGEALGVAVIDYLKRIGCLSILTSHYDGIKQKAFEDPSCLIGAMIFDEETIKPTFRYQEGMVGKSYALEVSSSLGLNPDIIQEAKEYVGNKNKENGRETLEATLKLQQENLKLKESYEAKIKEAEALTEKRKRALEALSAEKNAINKKAEDRVEVLVQQKLDEIELAYKAHKIDLKQMADLKAEVKKVQIQEAKEAAEAKPERKFRVGDHVIVLSMNNSGYITAINENKATASVKIGGLEVKTNPADLKFLDAGNVVKKPEIAIADQFFEKKSGIPLELNLLGLRAEEAREKLDKYMDDCLLMHFHQVRIIHGNGTGALRTMVQEYLKKCKYVASSRWGGDGEGGVGVTVVTFK